MFLLITNKNILIKLNNYQFNTIYFYTNKFYFKLTSDLVKYYKLLKKYACIKNN